jgi:hypothetical protein
MPSYSSYITAAQAKYAGLTPASFPGGAIPPGLFLDEAPVMANSTDRIDPPYVLIFDEGDDPQWTFTGDAGKGTPGQNALVVGSFRIEAYSVDLGVADGIIDAVLWNGQVPNNRAGLAFTTFSLVSPQKGMAGSPMPKKSQRNYAGFMRNNKRVYVSKQWFKLMSQISGDGQ